MSTTVKTGWLNDKNGDKFAPKTLISQVQTNDGISLEDKIQADLDVMKSEIIEDVSIDIDSELSSASANPVQNKVINAELDNIKESKADWNQNDENAIDYIKNRTHYKFGENNYLVEPITFNMVYGDAYPDEPIVIDTTDFTVGSILYVIWNDVVYETTVKYHNMAMYNYIGDNGNEGTGEPFMISDIDGNGTLTITDYTNNYTGDVNFALAKSLASIKKLDIEYLPVDDELSETGEGLLQNATVTKKINEFEQTVKSDINKINNKLPYTETIPSNLEIGDVDSYCYYGEKLLTVEDLVGSVVFGDSSENGYIEHTITDNDIVKESWGIFFTYGLIINKAPIEFLGKTYENNGLYLGTFYNYLSDNFVAYYTTYGIHIHHKLSSTYTYQELNDSEQVGYKIIIPYERFTYSTNDTYPEFQLCSNKVVSINDIVNTATVYYHDLPNYKYISTRVFNESIIQYDWGFDFEYGIVVNNAPATVNDVLCEVNGIYMRFHKYIANRLTNYELTVFTRINSDYLPEMIGATNTNNGKKGVVPAPSSIERNQFLRGDGEWARPIKNWMQNDRYSPDFIENRTHYIERDYALVIDDINRATGVLYPIGLTNFNYCQNIGESTITDYKNFISNRANSSYPQSYILTPNNIIDAYSEISQLIDSDGNIITDEAYMIKDANSGVIYMLLVPTSSTEFPTNIIYIHDDIMKDINIYNGVVASNIFIYGINKPVIQQLPHIYIPQATSNTIGGVKAAYSATNYDTIAVRISEDGPLYIPERYDYLTLRDQENNFDYIIEMRNGTLVSKLKPFDLKITTDPNKTDYVEGEYFDTTGMVISRVYDNGVIVEMPDITYQGINDNYLKNDSGHWTVNGNVYYHIPETISFTAVIFNENYPLNYTITLHKFNPITYLADYTYIDNGDGTYTVTGWADTTRTDELTIPNNYYVRLEETINE